MPILRLTERDVERLNTRAARAAQQEVKDNFEALPSEKFYKEAADATRLQTTGADALISVEHRGVRLRLYGGTVRPGAGISSHTGKPTQLLALPANKKMEAPGRHEHLAFVPIKGTAHLRGVLVEGEAKQAARKYKGKPAGRAIIVPKKNGQIYFRLVDETTHKPNPNVVPTGEALAGVAAKAVQSALRILTRQK